MKELQADTSDDSKENVSDKKEVVDFKNRRGGEGGKIDILKSLLTFWPLTSLFTDTR